MTFDSVFGLDLLTLLVCFGFHIKQPNRKKKKEEEEEAEEEERRRRRRETGP